MVHCTCGKPLDKVPDWLAGVTVEFICNNCPNRKHKNITQMEREFGGPTVEKPEPAEDLPEEVAEESEDKD
jgi:hypothetical protein